MRPAIREPPAFFVVSYEPNASAPGDDEPRREADPTLPGSTRKGTHVKTSQLLIASAVAAALALPIASQAGPAPKPKFEAEKCYRVAKAGKNDCQTANSSCAGTSKRDNQGDAWLYIPAGSCERIVGGSKDPKKA